GNVPLRFVSRIVSAGSDPIPEHRRSQSIPSGNNRLDFIWRSKTSGHIVKVNLLGQEKFLMNYPDSEVKTTQADNLTRRGKPPGETPPPKAAEFTEMEDG
ncbi:Enoyl-[acyl-carrier-protein] reductase, partial [Clarias magur]